jgi:Lipid A 3-O-deacylase (PagL)
MNRCRSRRLSVFIALAWLIMGMASSLDAEDLYALPPLSPPPPEPATAEAPPQASIADAFTKGAWSFTLTADYSQPVEHDRHHFFGGEVGVGYAPIDRLNLSIELVGTSITAYQENGAGGGFNLRARYVLLKFGLTSFFIDASAGILQADVDIPVNGTHFNFTETAGLGVETPIAPSVFLLGGARYQHMSNAGLSVNPGYNAVQFYVGFCIVR